jgi:glycosyltransferase involved in cell wall biosynthesis
MLNSDINAFVIIATKGRASVVYELLSDLQNQTLSPKWVVVVGADDADVEGLHAHPWAQQGMVNIQVTQQAGSSLQRNAGIAVLKDNAAFSQHPSYVAFFDDDFRPTDNWLEAAAQHFLAHPDVVGITGHVLADGAHGQPLTSAQASEYLLGQRAPTPHWASGAAERPVDSLYGCNMAFRDTVVKSCSFDEKLPLYGWQEDQDYTGQAARFGRNIYMPHCRGVHLGSSSGRTSGLRFGYSQIANPLYLIKKGTMPKAKAFRFIFNHLAANTVKSMVQHPRIDYRGRLKGNVKALIDLLMGQCDPQKIINLK